MRKHHVKLVVPIMALLLTMVGIGAASATPPVSKTEASAKAPVVNLTAAEKQAMQAAVDEQLRNSDGGKQVSVNQIAYANGSVVMTLPLPGETKARAIDEPLSPLGVANCPFEHVCLWSDTNFNGTKIDRVICNGTNYLALPAPFNTSTGSIHNNQTFGTQSMLLNSARQILSCKHSGVAVSWGLGVMA